VKSGDTMLGIAFQHGVSLEQLRAANPTVDPNFLSVGADLVIPVPDPVTQGTATAIFTPTPLPLVVGIPRCYPAAEGGAWCLAAVRNDREAALENISAWLNLYGPGGEGLARQEAFLPLNRLPPGSSLPLAVFFSQSQTGSAGPFTASAELVTAVEIRAPERYLRAEAHIASQTIDPNGRWITLQGQVDLPRRSPAGSQVWIAAVAYDEQGNPVGMRKLEAQLEPEAAGRLPYTITVFSLGPAIASAEVVVEARPAN
jgi:LysM repeat protein